MSEEVSQLTKKASLRRKPSRAKASRSRDISPKVVHNKGADIGSRRSHVEPVACNDKVVEKERLNKDSAEFVEFVEANQWKSRSDRGYPKQGMSAFDYVAEVYRYWFERYDILQSDFKTLDRPLWNAFQKAKQKGLEPEWLPMGKELRMRRADSSGHQAEIARQRELNKERQARFRKRLQPTPTLER